MRLRKRALFAYFALWARVVLRARRPRIVGVTGSVGKTTTKEVLAAVLSHPEARPVVGGVGKSPGNLNDNFGLPLAVLGYASWPESRAQLLRWVVSVPFRAIRQALFSPYPAVLVLEYAASAEGDIPSLAKLAPPSVAVVTAIGPAHLEVFGTTERIAEQKGALARAVPPDGLVVLGADNPYAGEMARHSAAPVVRVTGIGRSLSAGIAREVGRHFGLADEVIEHAIREAPVVKRRLYIRSIGRLTMIDDTINANPLSMKLALDTLSEQANGAQRKVALLGFMAELGTEAERYHREIGALARARADVTLGVGPLARHYAPMRWFETVEECVQQLPAMLRPGDLVLVKGSAASKMDAVASAIERLARQWAVLDRG